MRLGCEVTAMDINPVAWFILKCTLEYPQRLAGQTRPLPTFALEDRDFMEKFLKAKGFKGARLRTQLERLGHDGTGELQLGSLPQDDPITEADLAWHVRAWGRWALAKSQERAGAALPDLCRVPALGVRVGTTSLAPSDSWKSMKRAYRRSTHSTPGSTGPYVKDLSQSALGRQADGGLSLGAHREVQAMSGLRCPCSRRAGCARRTTSACC